MKLHQKLGIVLKNQDLSSTYLLTILFTRFWMWLLMWFFAYLRYSYSMEHQLTQSYLTKLVGNRIWLQIQTEIQFADSTDSMQVWLKRHRYFSAVVVIEYLFANLFGHLWALIFASIPVSKRILQITLKGKPRKTNALWAIQPRRYGTPAPQFLNLKTASLLKDEEDSVSQLWIWIRIFSDSLESTSRKPVVLVVFFES